VLINISEGERYRVADNKILDTLIIKVTQSSLIEITFDIDCNGILNV
jgi:molecular chaperone DnaK (HSP70)